MPSLSLTEFQILALLDDSEISGREVAARFETSTRKPISYGTLYTTLRRLREAGCVTVRVARDEDGRILYFKMSASGAMQLREVRTHFSTLASFAWRAA